MTQEGEKMMMVMNYDISIAFICSDLLGWQFPQIQTGTRRVTNGYREELF